MTSSLRTACLFSSLFALTACSAAPVDGDVATDEAAVTSVAVTSPKLASQLAVHTLPSVRLARTAFDRAKIAPLVTSKPLVVAGNTAGLEMSTAPGAHLSLDAAHGAFLLTTVAPTAAGFEATEGPLAAATGTAQGTSAHPDFDWRPAGPAADPQASTTPVLGQGTQASLSGDLALLGRWGIPSGEILRSFSSKTFAANHEFGVAQTPVHHRTKSFVLRGFGNIGVRGHRAIVTHAPDGSITRVLANWPAIAARGHKLSTKLTAANILSRANSAIAAERITTGAAVVSLEYAPTLLSTGECTLQLTGVVKVTGSDGEHGDEARVIDFDVAAY